LGARGWVAGWAQRNAWRPRVSGYLSGVCQTPGRKACGLRFNGLLCAAHSRDLPPPASQERSATCNEAADLNQSSNSNLYRPVGSLWFSPKSADRRNSSSVSGDSSGGGRTAGRAMRKFCRTARRINMHSGAGRGNLLVPSNFVWLARRAPSKTRGELK